MSNFQTVPIITRANKKATEKSFLKKFAATLIFYVFLSLFTYSDFINVQLEAKKRDPIGGLSLPLFCLIVVAAFILDKEFRRLLFSSVVILYVAILVFYAGMGGFVFGNIDNFAMGQDILICLFPIGGLAMFRIIANSYRPKLQLTFLILLCACFIYYSVSLESLRLDILYGGQSQNRAVDLMAFKYYNLLMVPNGIAICLLSRQGWFWKISIWISAGVVLYSLGYISATRSSLLTMLPIILLPILVLFYPISNGVITDKLLILREKHLTTILIFIGILILSAILFLNFEQWSTDIFQNSVIFERLFDPDKMTRKSSQLRIDEAIVGLQILDENNDFLLGRGLGSSFWTPLGYEVNSFHIGILTFLFKGGLILFALVVFIVYVRLPILFIQSLLKPRTIESRKRTALLTVLPGVFGWAFLLLLSGGFDLCSFLGVGFGFGAYEEIRKHGLGLFFE